MSFYVLFVANFSSFAIFVPTTMHDESKRKRERARETQRDREGARERERKKRIQSSGHYDWHIVTVSSDKQQKENILEYLIVIWMTNIENTRNVRIRINIYERLRLIWYENNEEPGIIDIMQK